ncbi:hypothetical protein [Streptomyces alkaliphilus]|uniref:hypothetical protein n=1 Tax=Streptomyces alkaliphilus TaxID=1472722 RepID=UPI0015F9C041|nr:hypothetical protein [Streptomyces alkaliphilus]
MPKANNAGSSANKYGAGCQLTLEMYRKGAIGMAGDGVADPNSYAVITARAMGFTPID